MLRAGGVDVDEVADAVGYESAPAFKRAMGVAPGAYRRAAQPDPR